MFKRLVSVFLFIALPAIPAFADPFDDTINLFKNAGQSAKFVDSAYGYAVFPTVAKAGMGVGAARGKGRVYEQGKYIGDTTVTQLSVGAQLGAQGYSEMVFFEDQRSLREFTSGNFEFGADANAVALTTAAGAKTTTAGSSAGASGGKKDAATAGNYHKGMATFTIAKGGLMYEASVSGQKFGYKAR
jgi:lipid-binding SYLF domain-containing protein